MCNIELLWLKIQYSFDPIKQKLGMSTLEFELKYVMIHVFSTLISVLINVDFNILIF